MIYLDSVLLVDEIVCLALRISMATLNQIFPGNLGRLKLLRVVLKLGMPELKHMNPNQSLDPMLERRIRQALYEVEQG